MSTRGSGSIPPKVWPTKAQGSRWMTNIQGDGGLPSTLSRLTLVRTRHWCRLQILNLLLLQILRLPWIRVPCILCKSCPSPVPVSIQQSKLISLVSDSSAPCNWHGINFVTWFEKWGVSRIQYQLMDSLASSISFSWNLFGCPHLCSAFFFFLLLTFIIDPAHKTYALLCLVGTPGSLAKVFTADSHIPLLQPKLWQLHREQEAESGGALHFHRNWPKLPWRPQGRKRDSRKGVIGLPSYCVRRYICPFRSSPQVPENVFHSSYMERTKNLTQEFWPWLSGNEYD